MAADFPHPGGRSGRRAPPLPAASGTFPQRSLRGNSASSSGLGHPATDEAACRAPSAASGDGGYTPPPLSPLSPLPHAPTARAADAASVVAALLLLALTLAAYALGWMRGYRAAARKTAAAAAAATVRRATAVAASSSSPRGAAATAAINSASASECAPSAPQHALGTRVAALANDGNASSSEPRTPVRGSDGDADAAAAAGLSVGRRGGDDGHGRPRVVAAASAPGASAASPSPGGEEETPEHYGDFPGAAAATPPLGLGGVGLGSGGGGRAGALVAAALPSPSSSPQHQTSDALAVPLDPAAAALTHAMSHVLSTFAGYSEAMLTQRAAATAIAAAAHRLERGRQRRAEEKEAAEGLRAALYGAAPFTAPLPPHTRPHTSTPFSLRSLRPLLVAPSPSSLP